MTTENFWSTIEKADRISSIEVALDLEKVRSAGLPLNDPDEFTVEKFDAMMQERRARSNAEASITKITLESGGGSVQLEARCTESGIELVGVREWFETLDFPLPDGVTVDDVFNDPDDVAELHATVKEIIWRNTPDFAAYAESRRTP